MSEVPWIEWIEWFNTFTTPIAFFITIWTFFLASATKNKLEQAKEISKLNSEAEYYLGILRGIKDVIYSNEDLRKSVPQKTLTTLFNTLTELKTRYPYAIQKNKVIKKNLNQLIKLCKKHPFPPTFEEITEPFNAIYNIIADGKDRLK